MYKLLALDIDGTILDNDEEVPADVSAAVRAVQDRGVEVVLATGRRFRTMSEVAGRLALTGTAVCYNGAVTKELGSGVTHDAQCLPEDVVRRCIALFREWGPPLVYADQFDGAPEVDIITESERDSPVHGNQRSYLETNRAWSHEVANLDDIDVSTTLMVALVGDRASLSAMAKRTEEHLGTDAIVRFLGHPAFDSSFLEILPAGTDKWNALERLANRKGIAADQIVAIGDDTNDVAMVENAGLGIAMGNAHESVKEAADVVTEPNSEAGVARAIERYLLG